MERRALAKVAGMAVRTLHHYDELGLLRPSERSCSTDWRSWRPAATPTPGAVPCRGTSPATWTWRRVGVYGQGPGGTIAAEATYEDGDRIAAAISLERFLDTTPNGPERTATCSPWPDTASTGRCGWAASGTTATGARGPRCSVRTVRRHVVSFFDRHLR